MRTPERRRSAPSFRYSPLLAAFACAFSQMSLAVPTPLVVNVSGDGGGAGTLRTAILTANGCTNPEGYDIIVDPAPGGPFTVSVSSALPAITCPNVQIVGNNNITIEPLMASYGGICGLEAAPGSGLTKVSGVTSRNFAYLGLGAGMCGKLDASGNTVTGNDFGFSLTGGANIVGNTISQNAVKGVYDAGGSTITQNTVANNGSFGIYAGAGSVIRGNTVHGHPGVGTGIYLYDGGTIGGAGSGEGNVIYDNATNVYASSAAVYGGPLAITNNLIGTDSPGGSAIGTNYDGIELYGVGTAYSISGNVIVGQQTDGISIGYSNGVGTISGNLIGVNASGIAVPNGYGIAVYQSSGGPIAIGGNVISGNGTGVDLYFVQGVSLSANKIGTNAAGTAGIANSFKGINAYCADGISITGNQVSSNGSYGGMYLDSVSGSTINGNLVGTAADGLSALANNGSGISVSSVTTFCNVAAFSSTDLEPKVAKVLGANIFEDNVIAHNNGDGILVNAGVGNTFGKNSIHSNNSQYNINIGAGFLQTPDPADGSDGPNNHQNHPVITSATVDSGSTVIGFTLDGTIPSSSFTIDFYSNATSNVRAGQTWIGRLTNVPTDLTGSVPAANRTATFVGTGFQNITATATGPWGTSEFAASITTLVPSASILPTTVTFGNVVVGATGATPTEIEFRSNGTGDYIIDSITQGGSPPSCPGSGISLCASGDFSCSYTCAAGTAYPPLAPAPAAPPPSCKISSLTFHPMTLGAQSSSVYVCDNTSSTPRAITLSGTGVPLVLTANPASHDFGIVTIGSQALSPAIGISNPSSNPPATLGTPTPTGPFSVSSTTCTTTLASGATCDLVLAYTPTATAIQTGSVSIAVTNGNTLSVALQGQGASPAAGILSVPSGLDFGSIPLASAVVQRTAEIKNTGNANVNISAIAATAPFQLSHDCPASLVPQAICTATLGFDPMAFGSTTGELAIDSDAAGGRRTVALLATVDRVTYGVDPAIADYGSVPVGSRSAHRTFIVSNNGDRAIPLSPLTTTGPFGLARSDCGPSIAPRSSCSADVTFDPVQAGPVTGALVAAVALSGAPPANASLSGTGTQQASFSLPSAIDFGTVTLGSIATLTQAIEIRNTGNAVLTFTPRVTSGPFVLSGDCGLNLAPGAACTLVLTFTVGELGEFLGTLTIASNAPGGSRSVPITVRIQPRPEAVLRIQPASIGFGDRMLGTRSESQRVTITNIGGAPATNAGISEITPSFIILSDCHPTILPGQSCIADVTFRPLLRGPQTHRLRLITNATGDPPAEFIGRGCNPPRPGRRTSCEL